MVAQTQKKLEIMEIRFFSVHESCIEDYTGVVLYSSRLASYPTRELAQQHLEMLVPYFIYGNREVSFYIKEENVQLLDEVNVEAIESFNKSNLEETW